MIAFYGVAKIAEFADSRLAVPFGAHAWKHVSAALGLFVYTQALGASGLRARKRNTRGLAST